MNGWPILLGLANLGDAKNINTWLIMGCLFSNVG